MVIINNYNQQIMKIVFIVNKLGIVSSYKYLGISLNEFLDYNVSAQELAEAGGRAIMLNLKHLRILGLRHFQNYTTVE